MAATLIARPRVRIGSEKLRAWRDAEKSGQNIMRAWPAIRRAVAVEDAAPMFATARWDLARLSALDAETDRRVERLRTLAGHCAQFAHDQAVVRRAPGKTRRARAALRQADEAIRGGARWDVRPDPAVDESELAGAVLTAYRELTVDYPIRPGAGPGRRSGSPAGRRLG